ncbi:PREDICTED: 39S ribosomal protein L15, mitochondrial [Ceratosolen solmsi marchali]|uniref:Large ribosomal subunit protein uL15m n=1 Tax=Ceratosolen solmsi marchali TaxID=326594 RepID=A0AAJ7E3J2_9HYME|nr:PREDICTED: 39S ribosomal protein L15, mitochondrial [Ceratosolen solmsi marchali]
MARAGLYGRELALTMLRALPRVCLANLKPNAKKKPKRGRGQHGGDKHGAGNKGSGQRQNYMRVGYETGNIPFYLRFGHESYYKGHHLRRQYPPMSLQQLQLMIDTNRIDNNKPIDLTAIANTGIISIKPDWKHYGVQLTDEGADLFTSKVNIEVQWASEPVIAAIERNGGVITTAFYDLHSVYAAINPVKFFKKGEPIPRRMLPPLDCLEYYCDAVSRGYLADPEKISYERLVLAQKYGYELPKIEDDVDYNMLMERKDPRQIFYGLDPGWVISLTDKLILKPKAKYLTEFYNN